MLTFLANGLHLLRRRWIYPVVALMVSIGLIVGSAYPSGAISIRDIIRGGIQIIQGTQITNMSDEEEVAYGRQINQQISRQVRISRDRQLTSYINSIGQRLVAVSDRADIPYTFQVVQDNSINAFATVGGFVYIHTGLMRAAGNEAELAGVVAHEIAHITNKHALKQIRKQAIESGLLTAAGIDNNALVQIGVAVGLRLPRSRNAEYEADEDGLTFLTDAGYAPSGMVGFFEKLVQQGGSSPPQFLSTHPDTENRIEALEARMDPTTANQGDGLNQQAYYQATRSLR